MKHWPIYLLALVAGSAYAADGDQVSSADVTHGAFASQTFVLCDGVLGGDTTCDEFDLQQTGAGMPNYFIFSRDQVDSDCSGDVTIAVNIQTTTGGVEHVVATLNDANTSAKIEGPRSRFVDADITNQTACNDGETDTGVTVNMQLWFERR